MTQDDRRPSFELLADWIDGRLDGPAAEAIERAVADDERTAASVAWLREFVDTAGELPLHEPPPIVRQWLGQHFARWHEARAALRRAPVELPASLLFDSRVDVVLAGVRAGDTQDDTFHLAYVTEGADLVLDVCRTRPGRLRMDGQLLTEQPILAPAFEATASGPAGETHTIGGDELGRFCLPDVADTIHRLRVTNGEVAVNATLDLRGST